MSRAAAARGPAARAGGAHSAAQMPVDDAAPPVVGVSRRARRRLGHTQSAIIGHSSISRHQSPVSRQPSAPGVLASSRRCDRRVSPGCVAAPTRTKDPTEALQLLQRSGQCVFVTGAAPDLDAEGMRAYGETLPPLIFGDSLDRFKLPERIAGGGWTGERWRGYRVKGPDRGHLPNAPHMDGGEMKSDYFMMFCAEVPEQRGESFLLDGYAILNSLPPRTQKAFFSVPTQNVKGSGSNAVHPPGSGGDKWRSVPAKHTAAGRLFLRGPNGGHSTNKPDIDEPCGDEQQQAAGREMVQIWRDTVIAAEPWASRFRVHRGEALLIDNYRMLHARDTFIGRRLMYRIHCWTSARMWSALPTACHCGCGTPGFHPECMVSVSAS